MTMVCQINFKTTKTWRISIRYTHTSCAAYSSRAVAASKKATGLL